MHAASRVSRRWSRLRSRFGTCTSPLDSTDLTSEAPLRARLFSAEQMERHGTALTLTHRIHAGRVPDRLLARLSEIAALLEDARTCLSLMVRDDIRITWPASDCSTTTT